MVATLLMSYQQFMNQNDSYYAEAWDNGIIRFVDGESLEQAMHHDL